MTLNEFIKKKPKELRLGQWFVNCYWVESDMQSQKLYQQDGDEAKREIANYMLAWDWPDLPLIDVHGNII